MMSSQVKLKPKSQTYDLFMWEIMEVHFHKF